MADVIEQGTLVELKERRRLVNNVANHGHPQPRLPVSVDASNQQKLNDYRNRPTTRRHEPSPSHHAPHQPGPHQQVPRCQCCCWTFHPPTTAVLATPTPLTLEQQHITAVEGIVPTLQNIVATVNLDCRLDLKTIALHARNAEYNPKVGIALDS